MRALFGLAVPLLLLVASVSTMVPQAAAETTYHTISGRVLSDEGVPLEGVRVNAHSYPGDRMYIDDGEVRNAEDITDADGAYTLKLPAGKGWINVYYEKWRQSDGREIEVADNTTIDFTLRTPPPRDAIVEGRVVDADGNPIKDAEVRLQTRCCYAMPVAEVSGESRASPPAPAPVPTAPTTAPTPSTTTEPASDNSSSADAAKSSYIMPPQWDDHATTRTDEDGRFRFEAYAGQREIYAWAKGYAQSSVPVETIAGETVDVEVVLEKVPAADAEVTGRVIDANTGLPLARAQVNLRSLEWGRYAFAETDNDGNFRFTTIPGWAEITVHYYAYSEQPMPVDADLVGKSMVMPAPQGPRYYPYTALVELESGDNDVNAALEARPSPTIALIGYVVDPDTKQAVSGARVNVWNHDTGDWGEALTDATGSYKIMVRAGHYSGSAYKDGYLGGTQSFRVEDGATQRVDILMPKGTTKWAPCYGEDDGCGGPVMYARRDEAVSADGTGVNATSTEESKAQTTGAPAPVPAAAPPMGGFADVDDTRSGADASRNGPATFSGEGGGLPPYDPDSTETIPAGEHAQPGDAMVPGAGMLALLLAMLAATAIVTLRRR